MTHTIKLIHHVKYSFNFKIYNFDLKKKGFGMMNI
jgi:hypothetical protein